MMTKLLNVLGCCILVILSIVLSMKFMTNVVKTQENNYENKKNRELQKDDEILSSQEKDMLKILQDKKLATENPEKLANAIRWLGERRIKKAVADLIQYLDFRIIHDWENPNQKVIDVIHPIPKEGDYPAVGSLFLIGKSALSDLKQVIESKEPNTIESKNALRAIQLIFREDLSEGVTYLEKEKDNSTSQEGKKRLSDAVEKTKIEELKIKNLKFNSKQ